MFLVLTRINQAFPTQLTGAGKPEVWMKISMRQDDHLSGDVLQALGFCNHVMIVYRVAVRIWDIPCLAFADTSGRWVNGGGRWS